ncbi:hypothetical protein GOODEAATRI_025600 [Goodea atripinnis]|uniref:Uncharacterized protein n=1 Tax=Goodea atripinnis TaxID=208336 RepID=A0ABV0P7S1_9TELE
MVNVASPELIAQVIQQEGRYPVRIELPHWKEYRDLRGQAYGLHVDLIQRNSNSLLWFCSTGPEWYRIRSVLNPKMLKLQEVSAFAPIIHQVVGDLLGRVELLRSRSQDQATVSDLAAELYKFGFEAILFETRLGCLQEEIPEDTLRFITAVNNMLTLSDVVILLPRWSRSILPFWRRFVQAWDDLYDVGMSLQKWNSNSTFVCSGEPAEGMYLTYLLSSDKLSRAEVYISVTELMLGGVDTKEKDTNPESWQKVVILITISDQACRCGSSCVFQAGAVQMCGSRVTIFHLCHYAASHDEAEFANAEEFIPERWLNVEPPKSHGGRANPGFYQHHPYSFIPFGVGVRACVGKRLAEMEMHFALSRLIQHYKVESEDGAPVVEPKTRTLLIPSKPINLRFLPRT